MSVKHTTPGRIYVMDAGSSATRVNEIAIDKHGCYTSTVRFVYGPLTYLIDFLGHRESSEPVLMGFCKSYTPCPLPFT